MVARKHVLIPDSAFCTVEVVSCALHAAYELLAVARVRLESLRAACAVAGRGARRIALVVTAALVGVALVVGAALVGVDLVLAVRLPLTIIAAVRFPGAVIATVGLPGAVIAVISPTTLRGLRVGALTLHRPWVVASE